MHDSGVQYYYQANPLQVFFCEFWSIFLNSNIGQKFLEKFMKLSKIGFSMLGWLGTRYLMEGFQEFSLNFSIY